MNVEVKEFHPKGKKFKGGERFCVVDAESGKILDNANGWGYKNEGNALAAWNHKQRENNPVDPKIKEFYKEVAKWIRQHGQTFSNVKWDSYYAMKDGEDFVLDEAYVQKLMDRDGITSPYKLKYIVKELPYVYDVW